MYIHKKHVIVKPFIAHNLKYLYIRYHFQVQQITLIVYEYYMNYF